MNTQAQIKDFDVIDGNHVSISAVVSHGRGGAPVEDVHAAIQKATGNRFQAVAGSFRTAEKSPYTTTIVGIVSTTREVKPYKPDAKGNVAGFSSLSGNMFMDETESLWSLQEAGDGRVLIRAHAIDNIEDINTLMQSCSANVAANIGTEGRYLEAVATVVAGKDEAQGGDYISFVHEEKLHLGVAVCSVLNADGSDTDTMVVLASDAKDTVTIKRTSIVDNLGHTVGFKELEMASESGESNMADISKVAAYYKNLFSYNADFAKELEARIRSHAYC